tara:strand:+ start:354 stop:1409 length:1056 start_codon:yes stop_codon:yes gene_type:complete
MVRIVLSKTENTKDQMELHIQPTDTITANKWYKLLKVNVQKKVPVKKHVFMHGWIMDKSRTLRHILNELGSTVAHINNFNFAKHAYITKQGSINKDFNIDLDLSMENLLHEEKFNLDIVNQLHDKFVQLEGAKTIDNLESVSPYFQIAPAEIRWQISKINNLSHELFHWGMEYNNWNKHKHYNPEMHVHHYQNNDSEYFTDEDNDSFKMGFDFGRVYLGDTTVGKTYWDAFNDDDDHINNTELEPPQNITADFHMFFGATSTVELTKIREASYWKWLHNRGLLNEQSANTRLGQAEVGHIDFRKTFDHEIQEKVQQSITGYNNIYAIILDEYKSTYEWIMSEEEIDIQQHA